MTEWDIPSVEEQQRAYNRYIELRAQADGSFDLARQAAQAWVEFLNLYLPDREKMPVDRPARTNVATFPVHKTRPPADLPRGTDGAA